ncbi:hypothetical protein BSIN_1665 [Burkholderia singularis]|uniref:Uncharacterized protein n=1 Tax=Burkholderia singularis TaxID=1503053 RepID=A0A238GZI7_9BURK|nr:hypothetical protein BSIN_1665 [Burkholderia singularis]
MQCRVQYPWKFQLVVSFSDDKIIFKDPEVETEVLMINFLGGLSLAVAIW